MNIIPCFKTVKKAPNIVILYKGVPVEFWLRLESCRNLVHFICDFTKNDRFHFFGQYYIYPPLTWFKGGLFIHLFGGSFMTADCCNTLLQIRTEKHTSVFYADGSDCKTICIRQFRSSALRKYDILYDTVPLS